MLAIFEVAARRVVLHQIPAQTLANYPAFTESPDGLRWSPDGRKILVSWGNIIVVDAQTGAVQVISDTVAPSEWTPESDAVLYLAYQGERGNRALTGLFLRKLDETQPALLVDAARLEAFGFMGRGLNYGLLRLSPSGSKLAIGGGVGTLDPSPSSTLLVFETRPGGLQLDRPVARFQMGLQRHSIGRRMRRAWRPLHSPKRRAFYKRRQNSHPELRSLSAFNRWTRETHEPRAQSFCLRVRRHWTSSVSAP